LIEAGLVDELDDEHPPSLPQRRQPALLRV
jgi:hypothetical protein